MRNRMKSRIQNHVYSWFWQRRGQEIDGARAQTLASEMMKGIEEHIDNDYPEEWDRPVNGSTGATPGVGIFKLGEVVAEVSKALDSHRLSRSRSPEELDWVRIAKVAEEAGEAIQAYIGASGSNLRKGTTHNKEDVVRELLDTSTTALIAVERLLQYSGMSTTLLLQHIDSVSKRRAEWLK